MSIVISIFAVGMLIVLHELGHFTAARQMGMRVLRFSIGFFNAVWSHTSKKSGTVYQIGVLPLGGGVQIKGMNPFEEDANTDPASYQNKSILRRAYVLLAGPGANLAVAFIILFVLYASSGTPQYLDKSGVGSVVPGSPAEEAGLLKGDEIIAANRKPLEKWEDLTRELRASPDKEVRLDVKRDNAMLVLNVTPMNENGIGKIGIAQPVEYVPMPVHLAAIGSAVKCGEVIKGSLLSIASLLSFNTDEVQAVGLPGIIKMTASSLDSGVKEFFALTAYISLMLFLFNLLPLPALDGGRGVFLLYEAVFRRKVNPKVDVIVNSTGFLLLVGLLIFMSIRDIVG